MSISPEIPRPFPTYRKHSSGQAITTLTENGRRKDRLLGRYGSPDSHAEYDRIIGEWLLNGRRFTLGDAPAPATEYTVSEQGLQHAIRGLDHLAFLQLRGIPSRGCRVSAAERVLRARGAP